MTHCSERPSRCDPSTVWRSTSGPAALGGQGDPRVRTARRLETTANRPASLQPIPLDDERSTLTTSRTGIRRPVPVESARRVAESPSVARSPSSEAPTATAEAAAESRRLADGSRYRPSSEASSEEAVAPRKPLSYRQGGPSSTASPRVATKTSPTLADAPPKSRLRHTVVEDATTANTPPRPPRMARGQVNPYVNTESVRTARVERPSTVDENDATKQTSPSAQPSPTLAAKRPQVADLARSIAESSNEGGSHNSDSAATIEDVAASGDAENVAEASVASSLDQTPRQTLGAAKSRDDEMLFTRHTPQLVVETAGPRQINVGHRAVYKVRVTNEGRSDVQNTVVRVDVPAWAEIVGVDATAGDPRLPTSSIDSGISWTIDHLDANSDEMLTLELVPQESRTFDLAVRYTVSPPASEALVEVQEPKLAMAMSGPSEVFYGEQIVYKLTVSNPGSGDAENVVVRLLPAADTDTATAQHVLGTIPAGESRVMELELNARQAGKMMIHAESTADGGLNAAVREDVLVRRAKLDVEMQGPGFQYAGTEATYRVHVTNPGDATAEDLEVTATLPPGAKYVTSSGGGRLDDKKATVTWTLSSLQPGADQVFELTCQPGMAGLNRHEVVATAADGLRDATILSTEVEALADLELNVEDPKGPVPVGQPAEYEIVIRNRGAEAASGVEAVAYFSEGIEPISVSGAGHEILPGQVIFDVLPTVAAGQEITMKIKAQASMAGNHSFRVELRCDSLDTRLAAEETTRYFADGRSPRNDQASLGNVGAARRVQLQPVPADYVGADSGVTPTDHTNVK
ncbi:MAG: hypothetical protein R3C10_24500 [Pirellulales bacterium]